MLRLKWTALVLVAVASVGVSAFADDLAMRTGTWEFKMTGFPLDGVPPAMKAQLESEMSKPYTSCVTADDIKNLKFGKTSDDDDECTVVSSRLTRTGGDVVRQCSGDSPSTQTIHLETATPQALRATITRKTATASNTMTIDGKWVNASCKN